MRCDSDEMRPVIGLVRQVQSEMHPPFLHSPPRLSRDEVSDYQDPFQCVVARVQWKRFGPHDAPECFLKRGSHSLSRYALSWQSWPSLKGWRQRPSRVQPLGRQSCNRCFFGPQSYTSLSNARPSSWVEKCSSKSLGWNGAYIPSIVTNNSSFLKHTNLKTTYSHTTNNKSPHNSGLNAIKQSIMPGTTLSSSLTHLQSNI